MKANPMRAALCAAGCLAAAAWGASPDPSAAVPLPAPPFVAPVPERAAWTIAIAYDDEKEGAGAASPGRLKEIRSVRTGRLKRDTFVRDDGTTADFWYADGKVLQANSAGNGVMALDAALLRPSAGSDPGMSPARLERGNLTRSPGFPGLDWVKAERYDRPVPFQKQPCFHYILPDGEGPPAAEAWIDAKSTLPVAYRADGALYTFVFAAPPSAPLALPPAYDRQMAAERAAAEHLRSLQQDAGGSGP